MKNDRRYMLEIFEANDEMATFIIRQDGPVNVDKSKYSVIRKWSSPITDKVIYNIPDNTLMYCEISIPRKLITICKFGPIKGGAHAFIDLDHYNTDEMAAKECFHYLKAVFG